MWMSSSGLCVILKGITIGNVVSKIANLTGKLLQYFEGKDQKRED